MSKRINLFIQKLALLNTELHFISTPYEILKWTERMRANKSIDRTIALLSISVYFYFHPCIKTGALLCVETVYKTSFDNFYQHAGWANTYTAVKYTVLYYGCIYLAVAVRYMKHNWTAHTNTQPDKSGKLSAKNCTYATKYIKLNAADTYKSSSLFKPFSIGIYLFVRIWPNDIKPSSAKCTSIELHLKAVNWLAD